VGRHDLEGLWMPLGVVDEWFMTATGAIGGSVIGVGQKFILGAL
jgi:hypothetical protein